jgi:hypothetical protein
MRSTSQVSAAPASVSLSRSGRRVGAALAQAARVGGGPAHGFVPAMIGEQQHDLAGRGGYFISYIGHQSPRAADGE